MFVHLTGLLTDARNTPLFSAPLPPLPAGANYLEDGSVRAQEDAENIPSKALMRLGFLGR